MITCETNHDLAWAAGIIDGEGSIYIRKNTHLSDRSVQYKGRHRSPGYSLILEVGMTDAITILKLYDIFQCGVLIKPKKLRSTRWVYRWHCSSNAACEILSWVYPWLVTKKLQAKLAFRFSKIKIKGMNTPMPIKQVQHKDLYYRLMRRMKAPLSTVDIRYLMQCPSANKPLEIIPTTD